MTRPRSSSASGRSSRAIRRTSSRLSDGFGDAAELPLPPPRDPVGGTFGLEHNGGQGLADLVVELARDPHPLGLLCGERGAGRLAAGALEPVEHAVEGFDERRTLALSGSTGQPPPGTIGIDRGHHLGQPDERRQHPSQQDESSTSITPRPTNSSQLLDSSGR